MSSQAVSARQAKSSVTPISRNGAVAARVLTARWLGLDPSAGQLFGHPRPATLSILSILGTEHEHEQPVIVAWNLG